MFPTHGGYLEDYAINREDMLTGLSLGDFVKDAFSD